MIPINLTGVKVNRTEITHTTERRKLLEFAPDSDKLILRLDWSSLQAFSDCNRKGKYLLVDAITGSKSTALVFGAAVHAALEYYYNNLDLARSDYTVVRPEIAKVIQAEYDENSAVSFFDDYRTADFAMKVVDEYAKYYRHSVITPIHDPKMNKPMVEFGFSVSLGETIFPTATFEKYGLGTLTSTPEREADALASKSAIPLVIDWSGVIDLVAQYGDEIYVVDHKTTSILSADFTEGFEMSPQPIGYLFAIRQYFSSSVKGFLLNGLICRRETKKGKGIEFVQRPFHYSDWQYDEWLKDILSLVDEFLHNLTASVWPGRRNSCLMKWGKCPYFDTCSLAPDVRQLHINSGHYTPNVWKPV